MQKGFRVQLVGTERCACLLLVLFAIMPTEESGTISYTVAVPAAIRISLRGGSAAGEDQPIWDFTKTPRSDRSADDEQGDNEAASQDSEYLEALSQQLRPEDWPEGVPGYNTNPFSGVKRPGWFLEEYVDVQSKDPAIQKLNRKLWKACDRGNTEQAVQLLKQGAEVNAGDPAHGFMWTALMHCCAPPPAAGLPDLLTNDTAKEAERKRIELVDCLLEFGARPCITDIYGETPIHYAAVRGYPRLVQKLIEIGVDPFRENQFGCSAQRIAEMNQKHNPGCAAAADVIAEAGGYDAGYPEDEMGPEPPAEHWKRTEEEWAEENERDAAEEELPLEFQDPPEERVRGINDGVYARLGGVPPPFMMLPGKKGRPWQVRPEMFEDEKVAEQRERIKAKLEKKAILGEESDDLEREKEVWEN